MNEIKCPECGKVFSVDEASYASVVNQVRTKEFEEEIRRRVAEIEKQQQLKQQSDKLISEQAFQQKLNAKDQEIEKRNADIARLEEQVKSVAISKQAEFDKRLSNKEIEIAQLKEKAQGAVKAEKLEHEKKLAEKDMLITRLEEKIKSVAKDKQAEFDKLLAEKDAALLRMKSVVDQSKSQTQVAVLEEKNKANEVILQKENEIATWKGKLESEKTDALRREQGIRQTYELQLKQMQEMVEQYKDFKARLSTKMLGESLEAHCSDQYNANLRSVLPSAYFEKDNDASGGSKGDFIFRDYDDGFEYISIMFEMKNEMESTAVKHKNEDFFKKLNDDRNKKKCEYAVLVSLLEPDSELYNGGIVDVSHRYPKMYVIRPQFFIPLITLLIQMAKKNVVLQKELLQAKSLSVDITTFEGKLDDFKKRFGRDYRLASDRFKDAIQAIDDSIKNLQTVRENLVKSENYLRLANEEADGLTIRKLTYKNPTMKALLDEARNNASKKKETNDKDSEITDIIEEPEVIDETNNEEGNNLNSSNEYESLAEDNFEKTSSTIVNKTNESQESTIQTTNRKANVGDTIIRTTDKQVGLVIEIQTVPNGLEKLILEFEDGTKGSVYNTTKLYQVMEK
jgi:hypothetical protein